MRLNRVWLRSIEGQLGLFAATFAGAVVLAVAAIALRGRLFEPYFHEKYPALTERQGERARELAGEKIPRGRRLELVESLTESPTAFEATYGAAIRDADIDPQGRLMAALMEELPDRVLARLRKTLLVGNADQRRRALGYLGRIVPQNRRNEAAELVRAARTRAARRGESELVEEADAALARLCPPAGGG